VPECLFLVAWNADDTAVMEQVVADDHPRIGTVGRHGEILTPGLVQLHRG
jgi:hypothetical protein